ATAKQWMDGALAAALRSSSDQSSSSSPDSPKLPSIGGASFAIQIGNREDTGNHQHASSSGGPAPTFSKANPFPSRLLKNLCLNKAGSAKDVRHFELDLDGGGLTYEPGDALGVFPVNCPILVRDILAELRCDGEEPVRIGEADVPLREALSCCLD